MYAHTDAHRRAHNVDRGWVRGSEKVERKIKKNTEKAYIQPHIVRAYIYLCISIHLLGKYHIDGMLCVTNCETP